MKIIIITALSLMCFTAHAQFGKDLLNKVKETTKRKVDSKIDQKTNEGVDKVVNAPEDAVKNKKNKKNGKSIDDAIVETGTPNATPVPSSDATTNNSMNGEGAQAVIQTNILCEAGKKKVEAILKKQDGVFEVKMNIKNGELAIRYSSDGTSYTTLLQLINEQGFEADGSKPAAGAGSDPCKKGKN